MFRVGTLALCASPTIRCTLSLSIFDSIQALRPLPCPKAVIDIECLTPHSILYVHNRPGSLGYSTYLGMQNEKSTISLKIGK